jgi:hypothetical protein
MRYHRKPRQRAARERTAARDRVLVTAAEEKLANFDRIEIRPNALREFLTRFVELAKQEAERRPAERPRSDDTGEMVETLVAHLNWNQADARKRVAKWFKKPRDTVAPAHNRYRQRERDKTRD